MATLSTPKHFTAPNTKEFLSAASRIFSIQDKQETNFHLNLSQTQKTDVLGLVLIYKFLEYTVRKRCFYRPTCNLDPKYPVYRELDSFGFLELLKGIVKQNVTQYDKLKTPSVSNGIIVAPFFLDRASQVDEVSNNSAAICSYYKQNQINLSVILTCISEIASNFRSHSVSDTKSIIAARGNKDWFEFACADTGEGVVSSLSGTTPFSNSRMEKFEILQQSIHKGISSKDITTTEHMGFGLWLVNEFITAAKGEFHLYSEGAYLINHNGNIKKGLCSYWKGTIVYIKLPLHCENKYINVINTIKEERKRKQTQNQ